MNRLRDFMAKAAASCFYLSYLPGLIYKRSSRYTGAGLIGSLFGLFTAWILPHEPIRLVAVLIAAVGVAVPISGYAETLLGRHDDPRIVIDEWVGMWFTLAFIPLTRGALLVGLILFRLFDTLKAPWVRRVAELPGGWGIVMDDVVAGLMANLVFRVILYIHPL